MAMATARFMRPLVRARGLASTSAPATPSIVDRFAMAGKAVTPYQMNQWVLACKSTKTAAIFDCGAPTDKELSVFTDWVAASGCRLTHILQTHAHLDHVSGLGVAQKRFGQDVPVYWHSDGQGTYDMAPGMGEKMGFSLEVPLPPTDCFVDLKGETEVCVGDLRFQIIETPGHAQGHVCFYEESLKILVGGDMIFEGGVGRTDLPLSDPTQMQESLRKLVDLIPDDVTILAGHGDQTTMGAQKRANPFLLQL